MMTAKINSDTRMSKCCLLIVLLSVLMVGRLQARRVNYSGYTVIRARPETETQLKDLDDLRYSSDAALSELDFWKSPSNVNSSVDIMASPIQTESLVDWLESHSIPSQIMIEDLGRQIVRTSVSSYLQKIAENITTRASLLEPENYHRAFQRYSIIEEKIKSLAQLDERIKIEKIGQSSEQRDLYVVKVSSNPAANKPIILIDAGHHAREWISHSTIIYLMESLVNIDVPRMTSRSCRTSTCRAAVSEKTRLDLDNYDYWFVPVINPDGYEYSHVSDRMWRKTRSRNAQGSTFFSACPGVDPNRNYDMHWAEVGADKYYSCSQIYAGRNAFSEPETRALASLMRTGNKRILMYLSLHAYSQLLLTPYGYAKKYPEDYSDLEQVARAAAENIKGLRQTEYRWGPSSVVLYPSSGGSDDYAYGVMGIKYSYTMELPDQGNRGFVLPPSEIIPVGHEVVRGLRAMTDTMLKIEKPNDIPTK